MTILVLKSDMIEIISVKIFGCVKAKLSNQYLMRAMTRKHMFGCCVKN